MKVLLALALSSTHNVTASKIFPMVIFSIFTIWIDHNTLDFNQLHKFRDSKATVVQLHSPLFVLQTREIYYTSFP